MEVDVLGLACATTNLGKQQIDTEGRALVVEIALQLGDLLSQHVRRVSNTSQHTESSGVCDGSSELRTGGDIHAGEKNGMLDLQQVGELCADLLCALLGGNM